MRTLFQMLKSDIKGATAIEYGLIAGLIAVVIVGAITSVGTDLSNIFGTVNSKLTSAAG
jgi:pilus assembly protein Flp/PilA